MSQAASSKTVKDITIKHVVITCAKPFDEAKKALESSIHELTTAPARAQFDAGDIDGAIKALEALPSLILFNVRPRHVGPMLKALNNNTNVVQVSITKWPLKSSASNRIDKDLQGFLVLMRW